MPSDEPTAPPGNSAQGLPSDEEVVTFTDLQDWAADRCGHLDVVPPLPNLIATVTLGDRRGWAILTFHSTGAGWALCEPPTWQETSEPAPRPDELIALAAEALATSNNTSPDDWLELYRQATRRTIASSKARREWGNDTNEAIDRTIQQAECALAIADETDKDVATTAQRLQPTWTGTAAEVIAIARELATSTRKQSKSG